MSRFNSERDCVVFISDRFPPNCSAGKTEERKTELFFTEVLTTELLTGNKTEVGCAGKENTWV